ncbi:MAG: radical SAM protein [Sumerlaeia bacterium]
MTAPHLLSIEVTNRCGKACWFCYNHSAPGGETVWAPEELVAFVEDCAAHGLKAVSLGGGEPLQYPPLFDVLGALRGRLFRSLTTNGLPLDRDPALWDRLAEAAPEKVHVSVHFPERPDEVARVIAQVHRLQSLGIRSGVNLVASRANLAAAEAAADRLRQSGIGNDRIVYLPMRVRDTPTPRDMARVAGQPPGGRFQSMSCLLTCGKSPRFASIAWDKTAAWCSYTQARRALPTLDFAGLTEALADLPVVFCGGTKDPAPPVPTTLS